MVAVVGAGNLFQQLVNHGCGALQMKELKKRDAFYRDYIHLRFLVLPRSVEGNEKGEDIDRSPPP